MKLQQLLPSAGLILVVGSLQAQSCSLPAQDAELFNLLRKKPSEAVMRNGELLDVVNARYEPCTKKKQAQYIRVITPTPHGSYDVRIMTPRGHILMRGSYADATGRVPQGAFVYYDQNGTLRAEGSYVHGSKTGVWHRYDSHGLAMTDKEYNGLDWDSEQVQLGLASMSTVVGEQEEEHVNELARSGPRP